MCLRCDWPKATRKKQRRARRVQGKRPSFPVRLRSLVQETCGATCSPECFSRSARRVLPVFSFLFPRPLPARPLHKSSFPPPLFSPPQNPTNQTYNGSYQADGSQVHGRQGPAQAARHQGCPQVGARHRCVFPLVILFLRRRSTPSPLCAAAAFLATGPFSPRASSRSRRARVWRGSEENGAREATARGARGIRASKRPSERFARTRSQSGGGKELLLFFVLSSDLVFSPRFCSLSKRPLQAVSRSPTGTARERSRSARSASTRSRPTS